MLNVKTVAFLLMFFLSLQAKAQIGDEKDSLRLLSDSGVAVAASALDCASEAEDTQLKQDAEVKLRIAGIKVTPLPVAQLNVGAACINVVVGSRTVGKAIFIEVALSQISWLPPQPVRVVLGTTWRKTGLYTCPQNGCREFIRGHVRDMIDSFVNDFLAVNPK